MGSNPTPTAIRLPVFDRNAHGLWPQEVECLERSREAHIIPGYYFYIARCKDGSLYVGSSFSPEERIKKHNKREGATWIKQHGEAKLVHIEEYNNLLEARRREGQVKRWSRKKKECLIRELKPQH